ncbi:MAG: VRR-NUC domain-containing protein [Firmicutes bacterium]|nr:VRR-NUC domain-containing protein [Bacillota bacterium]
MSFLEKEIERKLVKTVKALGGIAPKFVSPGFDGMPDRIVLLPNGKVGFVEVKSQGKKPRTLQAARHNLLRRLGFKVFVLDNENQIKNIIDEIRGERSEVYTT